MWVVSLSYQDDSDVYILTKVSDILHSIFSSYKEKVLPWFERLLPLIVNLIVSTLFSFNMTWFFFSLLMCNRPFMLEFRELIISKRDFEKMAKKVWQTSGEDWDWNR